MYTIPGQSSAASAQENRMQRDANSGDKSRGFGVEGVWVYKAQKELWVTKMTFLWLKEHRNAYQRLCQVQKRKFEKAEREKAQSVSVHILWSPVCPIHRFCINTSSKLTNAILNLIKTGEQTLISLQRLEYIQEESSELTWWTMASCLLLLSRRGSSVRERAAPAGGRGY